MRNKKLEANVSMAVSKIFGGFNMNALKFLLPLWMSPLTGAAIRCTFAAVAFWIIGWFMPKEQSTPKEKILLLLLGALGLYGFMFLYLIGLSKTTPVSSSIFTSLEPIWVFVIMIVFYKEKVSVKKIVGMAIGLVGALVCILTQKSDDLASDAFTGNMLCLLSSVAYAIYLVMSQRILANVGAMTMLRYTFTGAAITGLIVTAITGFDAPVLTIPIHWQPFLILMFVLIFPTHSQLFADSDRIEISQNNRCCHLWLSDSDCCYYHFTSYRTGPFQLDADLCHSVYLCRCLSG